mgnify:CR=1 FL=1
MNHPSLYELYQLRNKLQNEILNNKSNIQFVKDLEKAKKNVEPGLFKEVIYAK